MIHAQDRVHLHHEEDVEMIAVIDTEVDTEMTVVIDIGEKEIPVVADTEMIVEVEITIAQDQVDHP